MKEEKFSKAQAQITADKMTMVFQFVGMLDKTDIEYLREVKRQMKEQSSTLRSVQGVITDYDRTENKLKWNKQAMARIDGLLMIRGAMEETGTIEKEGMEKSGQKEVINKMFGL